MTAELKDPAGWAEVNADLQVPGKTRQ